MMLTTFGAQAFEPWSVERCMEYAVEHNHSVRLQQYDLADSRTDKTRAIGAFLPTIYGSMAAQVNFGRAIDPQTNTYTDVSTFSNGYGLQASLMLFDGLQRYNELRMARANEAKGVSTLQAERDAVALRVYKACMDLLYCQGAVEHTRRKREESSELLRQTEVMAEVGQKSEADVAQMRATLAADDYELTHMESQATKSLLALKQEMNYPIDDTLLVQRPIYAATLPTTTEAVADICATALVYNPRIVSAQNGVRAARYALRSARGAFLPTLSLSGGVSTSFFRNIDKGGHVPFSQQFKNNAGEYVSVSLSIPIFNGLSTYSSVRSRRIALDRAQETLNYERSELQRIITEAVSDEQNSTKEVAKMREQVEADSLAAQLTTRKYEEGLASSIDVRTAAVTLLQSRVRLLQSELMLGYYTYLVGYYKKPHPLAAQSAALAPPPRRGGE